MQGTQFPSLVGELRSLHPACCESRLERKKGRNQTFGDKEDWLNKPGLRQTIEYHAAISKNEVALCVLIWNCFQDRVSGKKKNKVQNNELWMVLSFCLKRAGNVFVSMHGTHSSGSIHKTGYSCCLWARGMYRCKIWRKGNSFHDVISNVVSWTWITEKQF